MQKYFLWFIILSSIVFIFYNSLSIIAPFFCAFMVAYFLYPKIDLLESKFGLNRAVAAFLVVATFCLIITFSLGVLIPELFDQASMVIAELPKYENYLQEKLLPELTQQLSTIDPRFATAFSAAANSSLSLFMSHIIFVFNNMISYTIATISSIIGVFLFPITLFYLLLDWHHIFRNLSSLVPMRYKKIFHDICSDINKLMSGYIRGQLYICLGVSIYYSVGFAFLGLPAPILIGLMCGFAIVVPLLGAILSLSITMIVAYFSVKSTFVLLYILILFLVSQIIEGNIVTPKIIGDKIGIHPIIIIFSVLFFGNLFGLFGVLFAIPISGILKLLLKHVFDAYQESELYKDGDR